MSLPKNVSTEMIFAYVRIGRGIDMKSEISN